MYHVKSIIGLFFGRLATAFGLESLWPGIFRRRFWVAAALGVLPLFVEAQPIGRMIYSARFDSQSQVITLSGKDLVRGRSPVLIFNGRRLPAKYDPATGQVSAAVSIPPEAGTFIVILNDSGGGDRANEGLSIALTIGVVGPAGAAGPQGIQGGVGAGGAPGPVGPRGPAGVPGAAGAAGKDGLNGGAGPAGVPGQAGPQGLPGQKGDNGGVGPQGIPGEAGIPGAQGPVGPQGSGGAQGPAGPMGPAGPQGDPGTTAAHGFTSFKTSGTFTVPDGVSLIKIQVQGAGGGGGRSFTVTKLQPGQEVPSGLTLQGGGGGGGGFGFDGFTVIAGEPFQVTVGERGEIGKDGGSSSVVEIFESSGDLANLANLQKLGLRFVWAGGGAWGKDATSAGMGAGGAGGAEGVSSGGDYLGKSVVAGENGVDGGPGGLPVAGGPGDGSLTGIGGSSDQSGLDGAVVIFW